MTQGANVLLFINTFNAKIDRLIRLVLNLGYYRLTLNLGAAGPAAGPDASVSFGFSGPFSAVSDPGAGSAYPSDARPSVAGSGFIGSSPDGAGADLEPSPLPLAPALALALAGVFALALALAGLLLGMAALLVIWPLSLGPALLWRRLAGSRNNREKFGPEFIPSSPAGRRSVYSQGVGSGYNGQHASSSYKAQSAEVAVYSQSAQVGVFNPQLISKPAVSKLLL